MPPTRRLSLLLGLLALAGTPAWAAPADSKAGDVRVTYRKEGTKLRAEPAADAAVVASLPAGTNVSVVTVKLPWIQVRTAQPVVEGWVRAYETTEPSALQGSPPPPYVAGVGEGGVSAREVSAAGRQFSEDTERDYRASRRDLEAAYQRVNEIEATTRALDPMEAVAFVMDGVLGRRGRDMARPARLPPDPPESAEPIDLAGLLGRLDDLPGIPGLGKPKVPKPLRKGARLVGKLAQAKRAIDKMNAGFTPTQEYYIGRAVAANAIARHGLDRDANRRRYVKLVGEAIVRLSDRAPPNHGGYHFDVLDSAEVNAISGPGGFVLVTRGAVEAARSEEELAAFVAHELAHVTLKHGVATMRNGPKFKQGLKEMATLLEDEIAEGAFQGRMAAFFGESVGELMVSASAHRYDPQHEYAADQEGTYLLADVLYAPDALRDLLKRLGESGHAHGGTTHADPGQRATYLDRQVLSALPPMPVVHVDERNERFATTLGRPLPKPPPKPVVPPGPSGTPGVPPPPPPPIPLPPK